MPATSGSVAMPWPGRTGTSERRAFALRLGAVVAAGIVLRVLYTVLVAPWPPAVSDDQVFFHLQAQLLADGHGFVQPQLFEVRHVVASAAHPPLYPVVLAGLAELGGGGELVQRLTGSVFGAVTIVGIALIARRLAGDRAALVAAGLAAVYPILITADGALMSESLYGALVVATLLAAYRLHAAPSLGRGAVVGLLAGLAALTRGEALLLPVLLVLPLLRRPSGLRVAVVAVAAMVVVLAPWTIRNAVTFHRLVPVSTDAGAAIGGANCDPVYHGDNIGGWNILCDPDYPGNEAVQTARQQSRGLRYARDHAGRVPVVLAARLLRQWSFFHPFQANPGRSKTVQAIGVVVYWLLLPFAAYGLLVLRRRRVPTWIILTPVVLACVQAVVVYGFLRFRHPAEISLVVLAGVGLEALWRRRAPAPRPAPA